MLQRPRGRSDWKLYMRHNETTVNAARAAVSLEMNGIWTLQENQGNKEQGNHQRPVEKMIPLYLWHLAILLMKVVHCSSLQDGDLMWPLTLRGSLEQLLPGSTGSKKV